MHYTFKSTPTTSFKSRTETITKSNQLSSIPGPSHYNVSKPLPKTATIAQTKQKRQLFKFLNPAPGPGSYQPRSYITAGPQRSMSARLLREPDRTPGPLDYQAELLKTKTKAPTFSMGNKSKSVHKIIQDHNLNKPGPGNYNPQNLLSKSGAFNFGNANRKDLTETERTPAPGYYSPQKMTYSSVMNPRCKIGSEKRQLKIKDIEETPGPAGYDRKTFIQENKHEKKGFTCRSKIKDLIAEELGRNPGPGQYKSENMNFKHTAPRCATTQTKRTTFIDEVQDNKKGVPAFNGEESNLFNSSKYRASSASIFGSSRRRPLDQNENTPGPLAYETDRLKVLNKQPSFSCTKSPSKNEFLKNVEPNNPGPGHYDAKIQLVKQSKRNSIVLKANRPDFEKQREKPGVGQYNLIKQKEYKFGHTKEKRISFTDLKSQAKDGTFYNIGSGISNPPSYMKIESKIKFSPEKSQLRSTGGY